MLAVVIRMLQREVELATWKHCRYDYGLFRNWWVSKFMMKGVQRIEGIMTNTEPIKQHFFLTHNNHNRDCSQSVSDV